jgi:hypothetical protein
MAGESRQNDKKKYMKYLEEFDRDVTDFLVSKDSAHLLCSSLDDQVKNEKKCLKNI